MKTMLEEFFKQAKKEGFHPSPNQTNFIKDVFIALGKNNMLGILTGKSTIFNYIDNFVSCKNIKGIGG